MDIWTEIAVAAVLAWASGIRLYAAVFVFGLLQRFGYVSLPGDLALLSHDWVLYASGGMLVGEFLADKIPAFDSGWDALHTFIRIPGGAALAYAALADYGPEAQLAAALIGGSITTGTHLGKSGLRAAINHSPEPFSNWTASFTEDGLVIAGLWLAWQHPWVFLALLLLFLLMLAWLLPKLWRFVRAMFRRIRQIASGRAGSPATD
ncbi:MAG: DUF4126 domain-containing protein [Xanthomonadales bacterium]|nr:DUF4126 domain-containing protein [Xanthomonadales bacterium]